MPLILKQPTLISSQRNDLLSQPSRAAFTARYELNRMRHIFVLKELRAEFSQTVHVASCVHIDCNEHRNRLFFSEVRGFSETYEGRANPLMFIRFQTGLAVCW
jgi:hypothetical protein